MAIQTVRAWVVLVLGTLAVLVGLNSDELAFVTAGFGVLGVEPLMRAGDEVSG